MALTIASFNVRGLRDNAKRREVFNWLRSKNFAIYMLQEVHCTENTNHVWSVEWDIKLFLVPTKATKREYAYFFNNNFNLQIQNVLSTLWDASLSAI